MPSAGLVGAGAGTINALAAVELAATSEIPTRRRSLEKKRCPAASSPHQ